MTQRGLLRLGVVAMVALAGAVAWRLFAHRAAPAAATALAAAPAEPAPVATVATAAPAATKPVAPQAEPSPRARAAPAVWDLCGIGRVPVPANAPHLGEQRELPRHLEGGAVDEARGKLLSALRQGDARARAAARYWDPPDHDPRDAAEVDAIARDFIERAGQDPVALRWALARCGTDACREAAATQWALLESDNAAPWLMRLASASRRDDDSLRALWAARRFNAHWGALADTARRAMPADVPAYLQVNLMIDALNIDVALQDGSFRVASALCQPAPPAGSERQAQCAALGRVMTDHGDTLMTYQIGVRLREQAGLDPLQAQALRDAVVKLRQPRVMDTDPDQPYSCASVRNAQRWVEAVARDGEMATLRALAASASTAAAAVPIR